MQKTTYKSKFNRDKKEENSKNPGTCVARGRRLLDTKFSFKHDCLFCGRPGKYDGNRKATMSILFGQKNVKTR